MTRAAIVDGGRAGAREVRVWDPLVRIIHWLVALTILINSAADGDSDLHHWLGYAAVGLVGLRLAWGLIGPRPARFSAFPPSPAAALAHARAMLAGNRDIHLSHNPLGALMVYNIWASILALGVTGYMMGAPPFFGVDWVEEAHEIVYNWLALSIGLHVAGVFLDAWRTRTPLVRSMVTGRKLSPEKADVE